MHSVFDCLFLVMVLSAPAWAHPLDDFDVSKPLEAKQLKPLALDELRFLRNSIHARHGRKFESASLATFFASRDWYTPDPQYSDAQLTAVEKANVDLIARAEKARGGAMTEAQYLEWLASTLVELVPDGSVGIKASSSGGWEVPLACGVAEVRASFSASSNEVSLAEEYLEGGEIVFAFSVLLRDGKGRWIALQSSAPKTEVIVEREGKHTLVDGRRYASPSGLRTRETISAAGCRKTGH